MARGIDEAVREVCLWLPDAEEFLSHGSPNFRVRGKTFASYVINHHGDGRVALWLNAPPGSQELHVRTQSQHFFVPPYVGPRGWLGVILDRGIEWNRVAALVREGYEKVAPPKLKQRIGKTPKFKAPGKRLPASRIDPFKTPPRASRAEKTARDLPRIFRSRAKHASSGHRRGSRASGLSRWPVMPPSG